MVSWKSGVVLVALLVALGAYIVQSRPRAAPSQFGQILPCDITNTVLVRVEAGGRSVEVVRAGPGEPWQVTRPVNAPADAETMQFFTQSLHSVQALNTIASPESLSAYGLDPPSRTVTCRVTSGKSYTLTVGKESFDSSGYYAQRGGDSRVYVISSIPVDHFDRELAEPPVKPTPSSSPARG